MGQLSFAVKMPLQQIFTQELNRLHGRHSRGEEYFSQQLIKCGAK